jgi:hypothetical protein
MQRRGSDSRDDQEDVNRDDFFRWTGRYLLPDSAIPVPRSTFNRREAIVESMGSIRML